LAPWLSRFIRSIESEQVVKVRQRVASYDFDIHGNFGSLSAVFVADLAQRMGAEVPSSIAYLLKTPGCGRGHGEVGNFDL
jgi:hypothetical protein